MTDDHALDRFGPEVGEPIESTPPLPFPIDVEHAAALFSEDPGRAIVYVVEQIQNHIGGQFPPPLVPWIAQQLPRAVVEAAKRPQPSTGQGFVGEILVALLDLADRDLLPTDTPEATRVTLHKLTAAMRHGVQWTADHSTSEVIAEVQAVSQLRDRDPEALMDWLVGLGLPSPEEIHELRNAIEAVHPPPRRRRRLPPTPLPEYIPFTADRIEQGMHEAICRTPEWRRDLAVRDLAGRTVAFAHGFESRSPAADSFRLLIGYAAPRPALVDALAEHDTLALKLEHVLWGRWFDQAAGDPNHWARVDFGQLCADLCLTPHKGGGFRREHKEHVADVYEALTRLELYAEYTVPGSGDLFALRGSLWDRGVDAIRGGGALGASSELYWRPGHIFSDPRWRPNNPYLGHISQRLLQLDRRERWATRLGAYYAILARFRRDTPEFRSRHEVTERVRMILQRTGLELSMRDEPRKQQRAFDDAHGQLVDVGILVDHRYGERPAPDWRNRDKVLRFPADVASLPGQLRLRLEP